MSGLFLFTSATRRDPEVEAWLNGHEGELGEIARHWFGVIRDCGDDVRELMHDGHATGCVREAAFAYVNVFKAHVNVGFFRGAELTDEGNVLQGIGQFMRHVRIRPGEDVSTGALHVLIESAYADMRRRLEAP